MNGQQLKNSILQMAVQGKLVPQDPNDEPASVLLERIRKEKERLIKEGKIKKEKNPSYIFRGADNLPYEKVGNNEPVCIADEVPFDIPDSWEWVRLKELCFIINGFTPLRTNMEYWENPTIPWFTVDDIRRQGRRIKSTIQSINEKALAKNTNRILPSGTVLLCCTASVGEFAITEIPLTTNQQFNGLVVKDYWKKYFWNEFLFKISETFKDRLLLLAGKTTFNFISVKKLENLVIPLPPIDEQKRIVHKINELIYSVEIYGKLENEVAKLQVDFPDKLRKSILQEAIQGKLVPQDPNDEPAEVLLDRIGKIKKDKHESVIFRRDNSYYEKCGSIEICIDDEIPFEIPDSWEWTRLNNICTKLVDGDHNPPKGSLTKTEYIMASSTNINNDTLVEMEKVRYLTKEIFEKENERTKVEKGDIFFTSVGSLGRSCVYIGGLNICFQRSVSVITTLIFNYYLKYCLDSEYIQQKIKSDATGTAQKGFYLNQLSKLLIPIPPKNEQKRISDALKHIFSITSAF